MPLFRSKRVLAAAAAGLVLTAGGGTAFAVTQSGEGPERGPALADVAERLGVTEEALQDAFQAEALERLDAAVAEGRIDADRAAQIRERIEAGLPPLRGDHRGPGPRGHGGPGMPFVELAAEYLGIDREELVTELRDGSTLAEAAVAHGKTAEGLEQALLDQAKERIHELVTSELPSRPDAPPADGS